MAQAKAKTTETKASVTAFIKKTDKAKQEDSIELLKIFEKASGFEPRMWGPSIIGFGSYHFKYESGREGDAPFCGFSPRKQEFSLYLSSGFAEREELLKKFGKHKSAKACIYIKKLEDIDVTVLKKMISLSVKHTKSIYK
ncbi:MAG TPA: DUF1801 domain-containing protein [Ferruginibacter sp.]|nr:DUF1801 domain-containing protein [Ferruginibacter sp.]